MSLSSQRSLRACSADEVGSNDVDKIARGYDLCAFPELREMALIAGNQIIGPASVSAINQDVVVGIGGDLVQAGWHNDMRVVLN
jgi:hypothetical protein